MMATSCNECTSSNFDVFKECKKYKDKNSLYREENNHDSCFMVMLHDNSNHNICSMC